MLRTRDRAVTCVVIALGVAVRVLVWSDGRPLWADEAMLMLSFRVEPAQWLQGLPFDQSAPLGYLAISKLSVWVFGEGEHSLRLSSLVAGIATIPAMYLLSRRLMTFPWAVIPVAITCLSAPLIYYAAEVKPYAFDPLAASLVLLAALAYRAAPSRSRMFLGIATGLVAVLISQSAVFVVVGSAVWLVLGEHRGRTMLLACTWVGLALLAYLQARASLGPNGRAFMDGYWESAFLPGLPTDLAEARTYGDAIAGLARHVVGSHSTGLVVLSVAALGAFGAWRQDSDGPSHATLLLLPLLLTIFSSALGLFPFSTIGGSVWSGRLLLFLLPGIALLIGFGGRAIHRMATRWRPGAGWTAAVIATTIVIDIGYRGIRTSLDQSIEFPRPDTPAVVRTIARNPEWGSVVVPPHLTPVLLYYLRRSGLDTPVLPLDRIGTREDGIGWIYFDRARQSGEEAEILRRYCGGPDRCTRMRLGEQLLIRIAP